jgi:hypothetical protein
MFLSVQHRYQSLCRKVASCRKALIATTEECKSQCTSLTGCRSAVKAVLQAAQPCNMQARVGTRQLLAVVL